MLAGLWLRTAELWPVAALLLALLAVSIAAHYPPQIKSVDRRWQWLLPVLRGAGMLALCVSVLRPVLTRTKTVAEQGAVVVLMDRSQSMSATDRLLGEGRRASVLSQLVAMADVLGRLPEGVRTKTAAGVGEELRRLESLSEDVARARRELDYARLSGRQPHEAEQRLESTINEFLASAGQAEKTAKSIGSAAVVIERLHALSRRPTNRGEWISKLRDVVAQAKRDIETAQGAVDEQLYQSNPLVRPVCDELAALSRFELSWEALASGGNSLLYRLDRSIPVVGYAIGRDVTPIDLSRDGEVLREPPVTPDATASDLAGGLRRARQLLGRRPMQAIVLFSDGQQVGGQTASSSLPSGVPVFTVNAASPRVRDLSITHVDVPRTVFVGETLTARMNVQSLRLDLSRLKGLAQLQCDEGPGASKPLSVNLRQASVDPVELSVRLERPGLQRVILSVPVQDGEASASNNQVERWVKVLSQKLKVLAIAGSPGWDYRYLRSTLQRTPFIQLRDAVVIPGRSTLSMPPREILQQDLVVLHDVSRDALSLEQWDAIEQLVSQRGGSIIIIPGLSIVQENYAGHVLRDLLPYDPASAWPIWRIWPGREAHYRAAVDAAAAALPALKLDDESNPPRPRWDALPGFYRYLSLPQLKLTAKTLLVERESDAPMLTEMRVGRGRAFFMATAETWRWRAMAGGRDHERFWLQLVRHAADEPYALVNGPLAVDVDDVVAEPGSPLRVRARISADVSAPSHLNLSIMQEGQVLRATSINTAPDAIEGRYVTTISDLPPGRYNLHVAAPFSDDAENEVSVPIHIRLSGEAEMASLAGDRDYLQHRLSEPTGGALLNLDQIGELPSLLAEARRRQSQTSELELWNSGYLFIFVLSCLAAEWAVRKKVGLA